ncbi:MAG: threonine ammonia-lyase [Bdellovibrionales bacterium]|nr:threonine ammonia-lyase [Bdellovibrionales bacterium]
MTIKLEDIKAAQLRIADHIQKTQCTISRSATAILGTNIYFKFENEQRTGSFKIRGAMNKIAQLTKEELSKGIVACSAGNHAQGVAFSATTLGTKAHIVMPENSPLIKVMATQGYGAEVILHGEIFDESYNKAKELEAEKGYTFVHPFNDPHVMAGQGTIGLEIFEQVADLDSVVIPIGGGGLISGIASAVKALNPKIKVYGAVAKNVPGMYQLFKGETYDPSTKKSTIADGLAVKQPNQSIFENYIHPLVDDVVMVDEDEIASSIVFLLERAKTVVEGAGSVGLAAAMKMKGQWALGKNSCIILCGGNIDLNIISKTIERGLSKIGRVARVRLVVADQPGVLNILTGVIAAKKANVIQVHHDRLAPGIEMNETLIEFLLECKSIAHINSVIQGLRESGARIVSEDY